MNYIRICVSSPKGGVGKTFISAHLAWALANRGISTALIDLGSALVATKFISRATFNKFRMAEGKTNNDFQTVEKINDNLVVAMCEDWDKLPKYSSQMDALFMNPRFPPGIINGGNQLSGCRVFIFDTDHYIKSLSKFTSYFDLVYLVVDPGDFNSLDNFADFWNIAYNHHKASDRNFNMKILSNRTKQPTTAKNKIKTWMKSTYKDLDLDQEDIRKTISKFESCYIKEFSIPKFTKIKDSFIKSTPIWDQSESNRIAFDRLADDVMKILQ